MSTRLTAGLSVARSSATHYIVRPEGVRVADATTARQGLLTALLADGTAEEVVTVRFAGDVGIEAVFGSASGEIVSLGWEGLLVPYSERRKVPLPRGFDATPDATCVPVDTLLELQPNREWILRTPHLDLGESLLIHREGELIGWVPIWRVAPLVSVIRMVCIRPDVYSDEERRRTFLRLASFAHAVAIQCGQGRSVITWLPDDGDPVNELKLSVGGAATGTHWMQVAIRRDLAPAQ
jgi:hypothetical protein